MTVVPFSLTGSVVLMAIFGDHGLVRRHELRQELVHTEARNEMLRIQNAEMVREIELLEQEDKGVKRLAAEALLMAPEGSTIYRFE